MTNLSSVSHLASILFKLFFKIYLFYYFWLHWVLIALWGLSVAAVCGLAHRLLAAVASLAVAQGLSCPVACGGLSA